LREHSVLNVLAFPGLTRVLREHGRSKGACVLALPGGIGSGMAAASA
jgi:hypothetical protein